MKKIALMAVMAGLVLCSCNHRKVVDETIETDRYTLHIQDLKTWNIANDRNVKWISCIKPDTTVLSTTIPELAMHLAAMTRGPHLDSVMFYVNLDKQTFLPTYVYTIVDHDTSQPKDYSQLMQALMDEGILRADTTYEPRQLLVIFDSARLNAHLMMDADSGVTSPGFMAVQMQQNYRLPVTLGPGVTMDLKTDEYFLGDNWEKDSLWLDERGLRVVPDLQGSLLRILTFNRAKGRI